VSFRWNALFIFFEPLLDLCDRCDPGGSLDWQAEAPPRLEIETAVNCGHA
jgi:hypothetical protein